MKETQLAKKFSKQLMKMYPWAYFYKIPDTSYLGGKKPFDGFAVVSGVFFAIEFKQKGRKLTKYQAIQFNQVERAGAFAMRVDEDNFKVCLKNITLFLGIARKELGPDSESIKKGGEK